MASTGKKGKKSKGTVVSLQSFLSNGDVPAGTTQVAKNIRNVDGDDSDDGGNMLTVVCQLPTAPRANRIFDDNSIPHSAPFIAYVTNLPFDVREDDIYEYFSHNNVKSVRLPREDGETGRVRGYGYVEFESRDDLIQSLGIRDPTIKGRRIRIDLSNENDQYSRQRGTRRGNDSSGTGGDSKDSSNWRRDNTTKRDQFNFGFERNFKDQKYTSEDNNSPGSWRVKHQNSSLISPPVEDLHLNNQDESHVDTNSTAERPKLNLKPRTLPLPEIEVPSQIALETKNNDLNSLKFSGVSAEKVFGSAKPVDTSARDFEIEERLQKEMKKNTSDLKEISLSKGDKIKVHGQNWRQQNESVETWKSKDRKNLRTDAGDEYVKEHRKKYQDKTEGYANKNNNFNEGENVNGGGVNYNNSEESNGGAEINNSVGVDYNNSEESNGGAEINNSSGKDNNSGDANDSSGGDKNDRCGADTNDGSSGGTKDSTYANDRNFESDSSGAAKCSSGAKSKHIYKEAVAPFSLLKELLPEYDGSVAPAIFVAQVKNIKTLYAVDVCTMKALLMSKVRGKVQSWLHSKSNFIHDDLELLLEEMNTLFGEKESKLSIRRKFEVRKWQFDEDFLSYFNNKVFLADRLSIPEDELIDYIVDGIPDNNLRMHAYLQCFQNKAQLLAAFSKISLKKQTTNKGEKRELSVRCYNCNCVGHYANECQKPRRAIGACYGCGSMDHLVAACPERKTGGSKVENSYLRCEIQKKKETKQRDAIKNKNEVKVDRYGSKNVRNVSELAVTANKYSGLDDESE